MSSEDPPLPVGGVEIAATEEVGVGVGVAVGVAVVKLMVALGLGASGPIDTPEVTPGLA